MAADRDTVPAVPADRLLAVGEVAKLFGVRRETVSRWVRVGRLQYTSRTLGGHLRFKAGDVEALLRRGGAEGSG